MLLPSEFIKRSGSHPHRKRTRSAAKSRLLDHSGHGSWHLPSRLNTLARRVMYFWVQAQQCEGAPWHGAGTLSAKRERHVRGSVASTHGKAPTQRKCGGANATTFWRSVLR